MFWRLGSERFLDDRDGDVLTIVQQLIELCCKSEGRCFDVRCEFGVVGVR